MVGRNKTPATIAGGKKAREELVRKYGDALTKKKIDPKVKEKSSNLKKVDPNKILEIREKYIKTTPFANQRLEDLRASKRVFKKIKNWYIIKEKTDIITHNPSGSLLFYKDGVLYRYLPKTCYEYWKTLFKKGVSVEPIIGIANKKEFDQICKLMKNIKFEYYDRSINYELAHQKEIDEIISAKNKFRLVKSKPCGLTYSLHTAHSDRKVITLEHLIHNKLMANLDNFERMSIVRQIVDTIVKVWAEDILHSHPHIGNWSIELKEGIPKVRLIDFDLSINLRKETKKSKQKYEPYISASAHPLILGCELYCVMSTLRKLQIDPKKLEFIKEYLMKKLLNNYKKIELSERYEDLNYLKEETLVYVDKFKKNETKNFSL